MLKGVGIAKPAADYAGWVIGSICDARWDLAVRRNCGRSLRGGGYAKHAFRERGGQGSLSGTATPVERPAPLICYREDSNPIGLNGVQDAIRKSPQHLTSNILNDQW